MKFERALITGATSGIGEALAKLLAKKKIPLLLTGRNQPKLEALSKALSQEVEVESIAVDLGDAKQRQQIVSLIQKKAPDLIINNAGFGIYGDPLSTLEEQKRILEVNSMALLELTLEGAKALKNRQKKGVILNVSSVAGEFPMPGMSVYGASKAFVTSFSRALDTELSQEGIRILVMCPGQVETDFVHRAAKKHVQSRQGYVMKVEDVAARIICQIENLEDYVIYDWRYRMMVKLIKIVPLRFYKNIIWKRIQERL